MSKTNTTIGVTIHPDVAENIIVSDLYEDGSCPTITLSNGTLNKAVIFLTPDLVRDLHSKLGHYLQDSDLSAAEEAVGYQLQASEAARRVLQGTRHA